MGGPGGPRSSLYAPRDFDISPYFTIVKPTLLEGFNYPSIAPPMCFGAESPLMWLDFGRMRSLTGCVCIKLLTSVLNNALERPFPPGPRGTISAP
jgi:hypothetical protein